MRAIRHGTERHVTRRTVLGALAASFVVGGAGTGLASASPERSEARVRETYRNRDGRDGDPVGVTVHGGTGRVTYERRGGPLGSDADDGSEVDVEGGSGRVEYERRGGGDEFEFDAGDDGCRRRLSFESGGGGIEFDSGGCDDVRVEVD